jgi:hypothetical protein
MKTEMQKNKRDGLTVLIHRERERERERDQRAKLKLWTIERSYS